MNLSKLLFHEFLIEYFFPASDYPHGEKGALKVHGDGNGYRQSKMLIDDHDNII